MQAKNSSSSNVNNSDYVLLTPASPTSPPPGNQEEAIAKLRPSDRLDQYVNSIVTKAEQPHQNREEQILQKQQILEELQRVERELQGKVIPYSGSYDPSRSSSSSTGTSTCNSSSVIGTVCSNGTSITTLTSSSTNNISTSAISTGNTSLAAPLVYPPASLHTHVPIATHTVETQTGFLPGTGWAGLPPGVVMGELPPVVSLYSGGATSAAQLPISLPAEGAQVPSSIFPGGTCAQETAGYPASSAYHTPASPPSLPTHSVSSSGPATGNVPVSERPKMIPSKKADKKKLQLQQQKHQQASQQQQHSQQQMIAQRNQAVQQLQLQQVQLNHGVDSAYSCPGSGLSTQSLLVPGGTVTSLPPPPPPGVLHPSSGATQCLPPPPPLPPPMLVEPSHDQGCQNKNKVESTQTRGKKDKKRSVPSECDCPGVLSNEELASSGAGLGKSENDCTGRDASSGAEVVPLTPLGTPLHLSTGLGPAPGTGLQFVPSTLVSSPHLQFAPFQVGTGSVPLQYNHLSTLGVGQAVGNQPVTSQTAAAVAAQQLQVIGSSGVSTSSSSITNTSGGPAGAAVPHSSKSQVKKILLHSPQLGVPAGDSGGQQRGPPLGPLLHGSPTTLPAGQQVAQPPSVSQPSTKKSKKQVRVTGNKQEREGHFNLPDASSTASSQDAATHHQPVTAGIPLDPGAQGVVYANTHTMAHFPATMAPPSGTLPLSSGTVNSFGQGLHPNESGLMVATPAAPAKILNDQLSEMITAPSPQVNFSFI